MPMFRTFDIHESCCKNKIRHSHFKTWFDVEKDHSANKAEDE